MKKNWLALLLFVLSMMMVLNTLPMFAMAEAEDEWICSDCHIWVCGAYCPQCEKTRPTLPADGECLLTLDIAFERNTFFSKFDVEVLINGEVAFTMRHGESLDGTIAVPQGLCEIVFRYTASRKYDIRMPLIITGDTVLTAEIKTHFYGFEFKSFECNAPVDYAPLKQGQGGLCNGVSMTLVGMSTTDGNNSIRAAQGYEFVMVEFDVHNTVDMSVTLTPAVAFTCYCDGYAIKPSERGFMVAPMGFVDTLHGGDKTRGMLCFEVPVGWQELEIVYGNPKESSDNLTFVVNGN